MRVNGLGGFYGEDLIPEISFLAVVARQAKISWHPKSGMEAAPQGFVVHECEKLLQNLGKIYEVMMRNGDGLVPANDARRPGRPTIDDVTLSNNRDTLVEILSGWWGEVGWQLPRAITREELREALEPARPHASRHLLSRLLLPTSETIDAKQIRQARRNYKFVNRKMYDIQEQEFKYRDWVREAEVALLQAPEDKKEVVKAELSKRRTQFQTIINERDAVRAAQQSLEDKLERMEAAFAQDELLKFILKRFINGNYARNPLNFANAIAGLPYTHGLPFMGVWESYVRCSKLPSSAWPHFRYELFQALESMWTASVSSNSSAVDFFKREIIALPKIAVRNVLDQNSNQVTREKSENALRSYLVRHWDPLYKAIVKTCESPPVEAERIPYVLLTNFGRFQAAPPAPIDNVLQPPQTIED